MAIWGIEGKSQKTWRYDRRRGFPVLWEISVCNIFVRWNRRPLAMAPLRKEWIWGQYGSWQETAEEKIKRIKAAQEAWKSREDYIGDIREECPKIYNSWRAIKFTEKGKKAGNSEEWNNFRNFYNDVRLTYAEGLSLHRKDTTKQWSKNNFMWINQADFALSRQTAII